MRLSVRCHAHAAVQAEQESAKRTQEKRSSFHFGTLGLGPESLKIGGDV